MATGAYFCDKSNSTNISIWIHVKIRYENFHCSVIVDNMKEECVLLKKTKEASKGRPRVVSYVPSDLKRTEKYGSFQRYITQRSILVWVLTSRHTEYE